MKNKTPKWCCESCGHLLGMIDGDRLQIRSNRGHQYRVSFPVTCVCRNPRCKTLNALALPPSQTPSGYAAASPPPR